MAPAPRAESGGGLEGTALQDHGSEYVRFFKEFNIYLLLKYMKLSV